MTMKEQLDQYYKDVGIAPVCWSNDWMEMFRAFGCEKKKCCLDACHNAWNQKAKFQFSPPTKGKGITNFAVSDYYENGKYHGKCIPRIVVVSLSLPYPYPDKEQDNEPAENLRIPWKAAHWPETLAMVRSLLYPFIACENFPEPATHQGAESRWKIEDLFVHVRTAKCCSNAKGPEQEPAKVYANCSDYLRKELSILKPDVIVTQGDKAHGGAEKHAFEKNAKKTSVEEVTGIEPEKRIARIVKLKEGNQPVYWLRLYHPQARGEKYAWQTGAPIDSESNVERWCAMRKNLVRYGKAIKEFMKNK